MGEFPSLIRKDSVPGVVYLGAHVTDFSAVELGGLGVFKRNGLQFSELDIFPALIEVALGVTMISGKYFWMLQTESSGHPMKLPASTALIQVDLTRYLHMACIHLMACLVDGKL